MSLSNKNINDSVAYLRMVFWGGLLCILDLTISQTTNGSGWKFDFLNDFIGMLMITFAIFHLSKYRINSKYILFMRLILITSILSTINYLHSHVIYNTPHIVYLLDVLLGFLRMICIILFCLSMLILCKHFNLMKSHASWKISTILFTCIYLIPLGFFYIAGTIAIMSNSSFYVDLGVGGLALIPLRGRLFSFLAMELHSIERKDLLGKFSIFGFVI